MEIPGTCASLVAKGLSIALGGPDLVNQLLKGTFLGTGQSETLTLPSLRLFQGTAFSALQSIVCDLTMDSSAMHDD